MNDVDLPPALESLAATMPPALALVARPFLALGYAHGAVDTIERTLPAMRNVSESLLVTHGRAKTSMAAALAAFAELAKAGRL